MGIKLSHTAMNKYLTCGEMYKKHYVDKIRPVYFSSNLTFGSAIDAGLNLMLENLQDKDILKKALHEFDRNFEQGKDSNYEVVDLPLNPNIEYGRHDFDPDLLEKKDWAELFKLNANFFDMKRDIDNKLYPKEDEDGNKADPVPWGDINEEDRMVYNYAKWKCLSRKGHILIQQYYTDIVPLIKEVLATQLELNLMDDDGNTLPGVADLVAIIHGSMIGLDYDPVVLIDNKTAASPYKSDSVATSEQLAKYKAVLNILADDPNEEWNYKIDLAAYAVMLKKLEKNITKTCKSCGHVSQGSHKTCDKVSTQKVMTKGKNPKEVEKEVRCGGEWEVEKEFFAKTQFIIDIIPESKEIEMLENSSMVLKAISMNLFAKNYSACKNMFGRDCPYLGLCHKGSMYGLIDLRNKLVKEKEE